MKSLPLLPPAEVLPIQFDPIEIVKMHKYIKKATAAAQEEALDATIAQLERIKALAGAERSVADLLQDLALIEEAADKFRRNNEARSQPAASPAGSEPARESGQG